MLSIFSSFYFSIHFIILLPSISVFLPRSFPFLQSLYAYVIFSSEHILYSFYSLFCIFLHIFLPFYFSIPLSFSTSQLMSFLFSSLYASPSLTLSLYLRLSFAKTFSCSLFRYLFLEIVLN